jgi:uracil-DNA glycosylase
VIVCLGASAWDAALRLHHVRPKPKFGHGAECRAPSGPALLGSYHPSQQNTFTGVLKPEMLDAVLLRARESTADAPTALPATGHGDHTPATPIQ